MFWEFFKAIIVMGAPLGALTFLLVRWSLAIEAHKPGDGDMALTAWLKSLKKKPKKGRKSANGVHAKWMRFGGGFYGCMAVFTYLYIQLIDTYHFFRDFSGLEHWFDDIGVNMIVRYLVGSLKNFLEAILWFSFWPKEVGTSQPLLWLLAAYLGYLAGARLAWHEAAGKIALPTADTLKAQARHHAGRLKSRGAKPVAEREQADG